MTAKDFQAFIDKSGLKKNFIAKEVVGVPHWVISNWVKGKTMLFPYQQSKLNEFCDEYCKNNPHMQTDGEV